MQYFAITSAVIIAFAYMTPLAVQAAELPGSATTRGDDTRLLYSKYCSVCHGDKGDGNTRAAGSMNPPPRDFTHPNAAMELSRDRMIHSVTNGRPGTAMVGHKNKLSAAQIAGLVDYIRNNFMRLTGAQASELPARHQSGRRIFEKNCTVCHGDRGGGALWARNTMNPAPRQFTAARSRQELARNRMIHSVTNGRPGTAMQPFKNRLSAREIEQVVDYIRYDFMKLDENNQPVGGAPPLQAKPKTAPAPARDPHQGPHDRSMTPAPPTAPAAHQQMSGDMTAAMPEGLRGDLVKGREFYMNNCITCHGEKGDGNGPRSHFITPRPRNFTSAMSRDFYNRPRLFDAIKAGKLGTVMPAWGKVLSDQQIANVAEFVFRAYIRDQVAPRPSGAAKKKP